MYQVNAANCAAHGMPYWAYVYLHASDSEQTMQACLDFIGDGVVLAPDWEEEGTPASTVEAWNKAYEERCGRKGMDYYGIYPPDEVTAWIEAWPHWLARYNSYAGAEYLVWQFSENGRVAGQDGYFDLNQLADGITIEQFAAWLQTGGPPPRPGPHRPEPPTLKRGDSGPWVRRLQRELGVP
jgi:hypothetical protein